MVDKQVIEEIKNNANIVEVIGRCDFFTKGRTELSRALSFSW